MPVRFVGAELIGESALNLKNTLLVEARFFQMLVAIAGHDEVGLVGHHASKVSHYLRWLVIAGPVLSQSAEELLSVALRGVGERCPLDDTPDAKTLTIVAKLLSEHIVVGKEMIALGYRKAIACTQQQRVGLANPLLGLIDIGIHLVFCLAGCNE